MPESIPVPASPQMTVDQVNDFFREWWGDERTYVVEHIESQRLRSRQPVASLDLRPGGTVAGPTLMTLADAAAYALVLSHIGPVALAVTSSLNITFLHRPEPVDVIAEAGFLKLGRKLAVIDVRMFSVGKTEPVAQATVTYAIPSGSSWATEGRPSS